MNRLSAKCGTIRIVHVARELEGGLFCPSFSLTSGECNEEWRGEVEVTMFSSEMRGAWYFLSLDQ